MPKVTVKKPAAKKAVKSPTAVVPKVKVVPKPKAPTAAELKAAAAKARARDEEME